MLLEGEVLVKNVALEAAADFLMFFEGLILDGPLWANKGLCELFDAELIGAMDCIDGVQGDTEVVLGFFFCLVFEKNGFNLDVLTSNLLSK